MSVCGLSLLPINASTPTPLPPSPSPQPPPAPFPPPAPLGSHNIADASPTRIICLNDRLGGKLDLCPIQYVVPVTNLIKPTSLPLTSPQPLPFFVAPPLICTSAPPPYPTTPPCPAQPASTPAEPVRLRQKVARLQRL